MTFDGIVTSEQELRKIIPDYPAIMNKRIQSGFDHYSLEFISLSALVVLALDNQAPGMLLIERQRLQFNATDGVGNRKPETTKTVSLTLTPEEICSFNRAEKHNGNCSLYFLIPGVGHGLRVNGCWQFVGKDACLELSVEEVYFHCARAAARSHLWQVEPDNGAQLQALPDQSGTELNADMLRFLQASSYGLLRTQNRWGKTELSPRGDPPGFAFPLGHRTLAIAERPGNKVAISLRNILSNEAVALAMLVPGTAKVCRLYGRARISSSPAILEKLKVDSKTPKMAIIIDIEKVTLRTEATLTDTRIWEERSFKTAKDLTSFPKALSAHMNGDGLLGKATTPLISAVVRHDMKNLY